MNFYEFNMLLSENTVTQWLKQQKRVLDPEWYKGLVKWQVSRAMATVQDSLHINTIVKWVVYLAIKRAKEFLNRERAFRLGELLTESSHPKTKTLSQTAKDDLPAAISLLQSVDDDISPAMEKVLQQTRWNRKEAAERLQISYKALLYKMKENGLSEGR